MNLLKKHHISFKNAFNGILYAIKTQPNFRIHTIVSVTVLFIALTLGVSYMEIAILVLAIVFGFGAEMINTSLEAVTDLLTEQYNIKAKIAKDVAAGMMLSIAFGTSILGIIIFLPHFLKKFV